MSNREVVVLSGVRTAIADFGGSLKDVPPTDLAGQVVAEAVKRAGVEPADIGHCVFGNVVHSDRRDMYMSRVAALKGGLPIETPALTVNRLCGSGLQAVISAAQMILLGDCDAAVAGGAESMSRVPYWLPNARFGARMGDGAMVDAMIGALTCPMGDTHMGITAENLADKYAVSREEQDEFAAESHRRAEQALAEGRFREQILPIEIKTRKGVTVFDTDEHVRQGATAESLSGLRPAPAVRQLLEKTGVAQDDIDVWECNEAFAAQALSVVKELGLDPAKVNPIGSGISLGHPIGATGALITVKALYELQRGGGRYAVSTMCIGGGQGIAALFERV